MKEALDRAVIAALAQVELAEKRIEAFHFATNGFTQSIREDKEWTTSSSYIFGRLYKELNDAYRNVFMWGNLVPQKVQKRAVSLAIQRFLSERIHIMPLLEGDARYVPSGWYESSEKVFRAEINKAAISHGMDPAVVLVACPKCKSKRGFSCKENGKRCKLHKERHAHLLVQSLGNKKDV